MSEFALMIPPTIRVPLTQGQFAIIDERDAPLVLLHKWHAFKTNYGFYAARGVKKNRKSNTVLMHREILALPKGVLADHKNRNTLDNRRTNLRPATHTQNRANSKKRNTSSKYRGVSWSRLENKWLATICISGKSKNLGLHATEREAANAYLVAARAVYGEFVYQPN